MTRPIRTLLFSTLFPSAARPVHGIFVETRLRELLKSGEVETKVIAPVPWFPFKSQRFGEYGLFASTPKRETRNSIEIYHPRYFLPPKVGMNIAPFSLARAALPIVSRLLKSGFDFDLIDAHYFYPDGVAAGLIAKKIGKPFVVTARGSDLNFIAEYENPKKLILETAARARASIGVCKALTDRLRDLGAEEHKLHVLRNGVDLQRFHPLGRDVARKYLKLPEQRIIVSVGRLVPLKGHEIAIEALAKLSNCYLYIIGDGPLKTSLENLAVTLNVENRLKFVGKVANEQLKWWYSAADVLALSSSHEGWANVLLESMACGTPVVASAIPGTMEVLQSERVGRFMLQRTPDAFIDAINSLFDAPPDPGVVRAYAEGFDWEATTRGQLEIFRSVCNER